MGKYGRWSMVRWKEAEQLELISGEVFISSAHVIRTSAMKWEYEI
jgi:hypothetical protein